MAQDYARGFYNSAAWRKTQAAYLSSKYYICEECGGTAGVVHHIRHITPGNIHDMSVTLDWHNLKALCADCHAIEHRGQESRLNGVAFDEQGNLVRQPNVFLVCGRGNRAYIAEHKSGRDLVIDDDLILSALAGENAVNHAKTGHLDAVLSEIRALLLNMIKARRGDWNRAYIVCAAASAQEQQALASEINADIVDVDI